MGSITPGFACGLSQIVIPYSVTKLGEYAFSRCSSLKEIYLPSTLLTVESAAIYGCVNLERVDCGPDSRPSGWEEDFCLDCEKAVVRWGVNA